MGATATENIAIQVQTFADLTGIDKAKGGVTSIGESVGNVSTQINASIGAFEAFGKTVDTTSAQALKSYRDQGDALSATLVKLGATEKEIDRIGAAIGRTERAAGASIINANSAQSQQLEAIPSKARTAANAVSILSQAATTGSGSMAGLAVAAGNVATGLASVSTNAKLVAGATGIGLLITVLATAYGIFHEYSEGTKHLKEQISDLASEIRGLDDAIGGNELAQRLEQINQAAEVATRQAKEGHFHEDERNKILGEIEQKRQREASLATQQHDEDRARNVAQLELAAAGSAEDRYLAQLKIIELDEKQRTRQGLGDQAKPASTNAIVAVNRAADEAVRTAQQQATQLLGQLEDSVAGRRAAINAQFEEEVRNIDQLVLRDGDREKLMEAYNAQKSFGLQLLEREVELTNRQAEADLLSNSDNAAESTRGKLEQIQIEKEAQIEAGVAVETATATAEQKKRQLYRQTVDEGIAGYARLATATERYGGAAVAAAQGIADAVRRFEILVQARKDAIKAKSEFAAGLASLGAHDVWGASQHFAASAGFAAAAVAGGVEASQSSGGGGSGGGGGGTAASGGGVYSPPNQQEKGGTTVINLITADPYGREAISKVSYVLERNGTLNVPIYPTTALSRA